MTDDVVQLERHGGVAVIRLNRPQARNAINVEMAKGVCDAMAAAQDAGCIVITGADPAFTAGLDLRNLGADQTGALPPYAKALQASKVPMIAAVNGAAVTGGFEVALCCDFIVASERAKFADTHVRVGVFPGPVLVDLPRRVGMAWAREMSLTGNFVDAQTALRIGLANHVVPHDELLPFTLSLASAIAEQDRSMISAMRDDWNATYGLPHDEAHRAHREFRAGTGAGSRSGADIAARRDAVLSRARAQQAE